MVFDIDGRIALITGGASGIGLELAKTLLRNKLRAVSLVDINADLGDKAVNEIRSEFGPDRVIFVKADVSKMNELEMGFKETIEYYENLDIVFNNAGILNDSTWEKEISINVNGTIHGMLLALEKYLPKHQQGPEGVIINISSIAGLEGSTHVPVYSCTKHAIIGLTRSWGQQCFYDKFKVRVVAVCPGLTKTSLLEGIHDKSFGGIYELNKHLAGKLPQQAPDALAKEIVEVIKFATNGSVWVVEGGHSAYEYVYPEKNTMKYNTISGDK